MINRKGRPTAAATGLAFDLKKLKELVGGCPE